MKLDQIRFWIKDKSCGGYIKVDCVKEMRVVIRLHIGLTIW